MALVKQPSGAQLNITPAAAAAAAAASNDKDRAGNSSSCSPVPDFQTLNLMK
jgi:hypothetical protein